MTAVQHDDKLVNNSYTSMQMHTYTDRALHWVLSGTVLMRTEGAIAEETHSELITGHYDLHNSLEFYDLLFKGFDTQNKIALDFATGPGRNIIRYHDRFKRIDGVDFHPVIRHCAKKNLKNFNITDSKLYWCNGVDLRNIADNEYDVIFSTIALQHIAVHKIRDNYFKEFYRILKPKGWISIQMGAGILTPYDPFTPGAEWYDNEWSAPGTNGIYDVKIRNTHFIEDDLDKIGFFDFLFDLVDVRSLENVKGIHNEWLFFKAQK